MVHQVETSLGRLLRQLAWEFEEHFVSNVRPRRSTTTLLDIRQAEGESLVEFVTWFTNEARGIVDAHPSLLI